MHKIWVVTRREFLEKVRTKWFVIATVLGPLLMIGIIAIPILTASRGSRDRSMVILDGTSAGFGSRFASNLSAPRKLESGKLEASKLRVSVVHADGGSMVEVTDSLTRSVGTGLDGFLILSDSTLNSGKAEYRGTNVSSLADMGRLQNRLQDAVVEERLSRAGVNTAVVRAAQLNVNVQTVKVVNGKATTDSGIGSFILAYAMSIILYVSIILYGVQVMGSVVEEKTSRIVEVLVSSLTPFELMAGKILGVGAVGLFQLAIWGFSATLSLGRQAQIVSMLGGSAAAGSALHVNVSAGTVVVFLAYFLMGYFLYSSMLAAVAAMVSTEMEARQAANPIIMLLVVSYVLMFAILNDPNGSLAFWLSTIPFTAPIAMPVRWAAAQVPAWQLATSLIVLAGSVVGLAWVASRIYRVGILMYGKRPSLKELVRWVRTA